MSYKKIRERLKKLMYEYKDKVDPEVKATFKEWIDNMDNDDYTYAIKDKLEDSELPDEIRKLLDYIPSRKVWIFGGDGWAYVCAGAGFVVMLTGDVMTMPGLPKNPAAFNIDVEDDGKIVGLF